MNGRDQCVTQKCLGALMGSENCVPAIGHDTPNGGRKRDPQHKGRRSIAVNTLLMNVLTSGCYEPFLNLKRYYA
jgi:hypothetical protein